MSTDVESPGGVVPAEAHKANSEGVLNRHIGTQSLGQNQPLLFEPCWVDSKPFWLGPFAKQPPSENAPPEPYGRWVCRDDREVLFDRKYRPLWERMPGGPAKPADPCERVKWVDQQYFFRGSTPDEKGKKIIGLVLKDWGDPVMTPERDKIIEQHREKLDGKIINFKERWILAREEEKRKKDKPAESEGLCIHDFVAYMPQHNYCYLPTREHWPASSVNSRLPSHAVMDDNGKVKIDLESGEPLLLKAAAWLDQEKPVEQATWAPGQPEIIFDRLVAGGGWIKKPGAAVLNLYRGPTIEMGDASKAKPWLDHLWKIYPDNAGHILMWFAWRVQRPDVKINHALVLGSNDHGIGKDSLIEPVKRAVGSWNFDEVSPQMVMGRFNAFLKHVIVRINEARDLGETSRYQFYDHMKAYTAAPPDVLKVDEKFLREHHVFNCVGIVITSNHKTNGIFLPPEDRRHYVAWSESRKEDFSDDYWNKLWSWYNSGGDRHVAALLRSLDLKALDPKAPPHRTRAFYEIVDANRASEDGELADVLDGLGQPDAVTIEMVADKVSANGAKDSLWEWLTNRKNRRAVAHRMEACGYAPIRNPHADSGLWVINNKRQVVYAKTTLSLREQLAAAETLKKA